MAKKHNLNLHISQKLDQRIAPMLIQTMKILQLSTVELVEHIQEELESNPFIEVIDTKEDTEEVKPMKEELDNKFPINIDWMEDYFHKSTDIRYFQPDEYNSSFYENVLTEKPSLQEHLIWQLRLFTSDDRILRIADFLIWNITDDGFLQMSNYEILEYLKADVLEITIEEIEEIIKLVQRFEPYGICARTVQESLQIQLTFMGLKDSWAYKIVEDYYSYLISNKVNEVAGLLNITDETLKKEVEIISTLEPSPGREYAEEEPTYVIPDVMIQNVENKYEIILNEKDIPPIRISPFYRKILFEKKEGNMNSEQKEYIYTKLNNAILLLKGIDQRRKTLWKVTEAIFKIQKDFLKDGLSSIKPLTLKEIAEIIEMHEATVSRVTRNKYVQTPKGIYRLKYFFSSKLQTEDGEDVSSKMVKEKIKEMVLSEDKSSPLSDKKIAAKLNSDFGIKISRRAITKYREQMGILASYLRKQKF